ncbi:MAG: 6-bladed beta-propeller, partial [Phycisphaerae bacterium]
VWPAPPETPRIKYLGSLADSRDLKAAIGGLEAFRSILRGARPPIRLCRPHAVAIGSGDMLAVTDAEAGAVHIINLEERTHRLVTGWRTDRSGHQNGGRNEHKLDADGAEHLGVPMAVAWVGTRLFVTDAKRHEIIEFDALGNFHGRFGADVLLRPVGIAYVAERERLYVVDGGAHQVKVFDAAGRVERTIGRHGGGPGEFNYPSHIGCAGQSIVVADSGSFRVQWLDLEGNHIKTIGRKGDGAGDFSLPKGVAVDSEGHLYVVDAQFENVQVFDRQGRLLLAFGEEGRGPGQFWLPAGLAIDQDDRIWVADSGNRRIQVFAYMRASL